MKYKLHHSAWEKALFWALPPAVGGVFLVIEAAGEGISFGLFAGALFVVAIMWGMNRLYYWGTHWVKLREDRFEVKLYRSGYYVPYAGVDSLDLGADGEIAVKYRVRLWDGTFTSYTLPASFRPAEPAKVFYEIQSRVEAAKADRQRIASE